MYDLAYTPLLVAYSLEILPFEIRARGFAVMNLTVILTLAFNQFINPLALDKLDWKYLLFYCAWLLVELAFVFFFIIETKGKTLEETSALFDGQEKAENLTHIGSVAAEQSMARFEQYPMEPRRRRSQHLVEKSRDIIETPSTDDLHSAMEGYPGPAIRQLTSKESLTRLGLRPHTPV
jgi:MFS family permease